MKKWSNKSERQKYLDVGIEPPFQLQSQGIGLRFAEDNREQLQDNLGTTLHGVPVGLPRYYVRKLEIDTDIMAEYSKSANAEKLALICRRLGVEQTEFDLSLEMKDNCTPLFKDPLNCYLRAEREKRDIHLKSMERFRKGNF